MSHCYFLSFALFLFCLVTTMGCRPDANGPAQQAIEAADGVPQFMVDPFWPKPLPNNWLIGQVPGIAVDSEDHIWILHRPGSLRAAEVAAAQTPPAALCCVSAPPVIELDSEGNVLRAWGGPGEGYEWPQSEHGIFVDYMDNVWIAGSGSNDHQVLKFTPDGTFLLQIGKAGETAGSNDTNLLGNPADIAVEPEANEVYIAGGYLNRRVIVFDADTGDYKRHWGAYGEIPEDTPLAPYDPEAPTSRQFRIPVHAVLISNDGLVYICDRANNRVQVFQKDGKFVTETVIAKKTLGDGSSFDVDFSPDSEQRFLYVADGTNRLVWILDRHSFDIVGSFGRSGRNAGQFDCVHSIAADSKGNIYTGEAEEGKRAQKFVHQTTGPEN